MDNDFENGKDMQERVVPNDPEFEMMLRRAYDTDSDEEKEITLKMIEDDSLNKDIFEGILMIKKRKGFSTIEEHLQSVEEDKKKFRNFFNEFKAGNRVKKITK